MKENNNSEEEEKLTPTFDGRMQYYQVLKSHMVEVLNARVNNNLQLLYSTLWGMLDITQPFMAKSEGEEIRKTLKLAGQYLSTNNSQVKFFALRKLNEASEKIYNYAKHLLLPIKTEENSQFDEEDFLRGSDL